jgi:selenocysteine-specific elongation factor
MRVVATAGHVDHGKSSLVLALTGTDPDRFPEEKARGLTIDLGFAFTELPSGEIVGFVDVPGHVRFVKNMLAGVGAVDVALLVVAADEGWKPQTVEHTQILDLLDIRHGMVALTKADVVDDDTLLLARLEIEERMPGWPIVAVDSISGRGVDEVRTTLDAVLAGAPAPLDVGRPRLWVDRAFAAKGAGTVVTGTLTGGTLSRDDEVVIEPQGRKARVRGIESAHQSVDRAVPGSRVALNLGGIDHHQVGRGNAVVRADQWAVVDTVDVALRVLPDQEFAKRSVVDAHVGSGEQPAQLQLLRDGGGLARLRLSSPAPLAPGDRLVLRSSGAQATLGGAVVLDVAPARRTADAFARSRLSLSHRVLAARPWCTPEEFARLSGGVDPEGCERAGAWVVAPEELARVRGRAAALARDGWPPITSVAAACGVEVAQLRAAIADVPAESVDDEPEAVELVQALGKEPFSPPAPTELGASTALVRALVRSGRLVDLDGVLFTADALDEARRRIATAVLDDGELTVAGARDVLQSTRKYVLPILARMDAEGVTRRRGETRIPGPRATDRLDG